MIVPKPEPSGFIEIHLEEDLTENVRGETEVKILSLTVQYTTEESRYIENMVNRFYNNYKAINVGLKVSSYYARTLANSRSVTTS